MHQLKKTFLRGLALAIPLAVVGYVFLKFIKIFEKIIGPVAGKLGIEKLLGELTLSFFAIFCMLILMMILGLLMQLSFIASLKKELEAIVLKFFPWLNQLKVMAADTVDLENASPNWTPVLVYMEKSYYPAFLVNENETLVSFFVVKGSNPHEGEILTTEKREVSYYPVEGRDIRNISKQYGKGMITMIEKVAGPTLKN